MLAHHNDKFFIKNAPYSSVGELMFVTTGDNFERVGNSANNAKSAAALGALANVMCSSQIRLESCLGNVVRTGWKEAVDEVADFSKSAVVCRKGGWKIDKWKGQTLRFLTGKMRGEKFPILGNSKNIIFIGETNSPNITYSAPNRLSLNPNKGDKFSIGPGYASPLCFTRKGGEEGVWIWKKAIDYPGNFNLYLFGLNDSIDTTEFLEENNNAQLEVFAFNYQTHQFDKIPLPDDRSLKRSESAYKYVTHKNYHQYEKSDGVYCGLIHPQHISSDGGIKIKIAAGGLNNLKCSGFAWFDFAYLAPGEEPGKININTASERVLRALNGVSSTVAKNIYKGISKNGKEELKPYRNITDILDVKGMTPDIFSKNANLKTTRSDQFRVVVVAQAFDPHKKEAENGNNFLAETKKEIIVDRSELTDDDPKSTQFKISLGN